MRSASGPRFRCVPQIKFDFGGDWWKLLAVAVILALVNSYLKPILKILSFPITLMTIGLFAFVLNAILLLLVAFVSDRLGLGFTIGGIPAGLHVRLVRRCAPRFHRDQRRRHAARPRQHGPPGGLLGSAPQAADAPAGRRPRARRRGPPPRRSPTSPDLFDGLRAAARRFGTPVAVTDVGRTRRRRCGRHPGVSGSVGSPVLRQGQRRRGHRGACRRAGVRRQRRVARRMGRRTPGRHPELGGDVRGHRQDRRRPPGRARRLPPR